MLELNQLLIKTLCAALLTINLANAAGDIKVDFSNEKTEQVAKYLHEKLKGTGPYLVNGISIDPDNIVNILEGMDELYKVFSIAISYSNPDSISKEASTEDYQLGLLGVMEKKLKGFETFYRDNELLIGGARVAVILVLNPIDPSGLRDLKNILERHSFVYAFTANMNKRPDFEPGNIIKKNYAQAQI